jgi:hypothetical protein
MGWSIKEAALQFGVDEGTWGAWESGATVLRGECWILVEKASSRKSLCSAAISAFADKALHRRWLDKSLRITVKWVREK